MASSEFINIPAPIVELMTRRQMEQGNEPNVRRFHNNVSCPRHAGGFDWSLTPEGVGFWFKVLIDKQYSVFFDKYPNEKSVVKGENLPPLPYVSEKSLTGAIKNVPVEIVQKMLEYQRVQTGKSDITVFQNRIDADKGRGGFTWEKTSEGHEFWCNVLMHSQFNLFFEKYPSNNNYSQTKQEDEVQRTSQPITVPERRAGNPIQGRRSKTAVECGHFSYKAIAGRS